MKTYFDLIQDNGFRDYVSDRIARSTHQPYSFPLILPKLYRYRSLSSYAIDDIIKGRITMTSIGDFNDVFDGALHQYGSDEEIENAANAQWEELESHLIAAYLPEGLLHKDDIVNTYKEHLKRESRYKFRELDFLGTYVCCFSRGNTATLMWAHYADSNKGICIEYEFGKLPSDNLLRQSLFPIVYTDFPIDVSDLLEDKENAVYQYPLDAALLCSALNKASIWKYEKEWRLIWILASPNETQQRLSINSLINPSKVYLGYHFLKSFFYYDFKSDPEYKSCTKAIKKFMELMYYLQNNHISVAIMTPVVGSYEFVPQTIPTDSLFSFMARHFHDGRPENMRYYYTILDYLMDLIEESQKLTHE